MTEQQLNSTHIRTSFKQMDGEGVAQRMRCDRLSQARTTMSYATGQTNSVAGQRPTWDLPWEQPSHGFHQPPVAAQRVQQFGREHDVAIFLTLSLLDADDHPLPINCSRSWVEGFGYPQAGGIAGGQDRAMFDAIDMAQKQQHVFRTENNRQRFRRVPDKAGEMIQHLAKLRGIGVQSATALVREAFVREFGNGKALGSYAGLCATPYSSGGTDREQGISKAGNRRL
jgi:hypothetical protein